MKNILLTAAIAAASLSLTACSPYSEGARTGTVTKISYKGYVCKSYEGELLMGGLRNTTDSDGKAGVAANIFLYSVKDESIVEDLKRAAETGARVTLAYEQFALPEICGRKTGYIITGVFTPAPSPMPQLRGPQGFTSEKP